MEDRMARDTLTHHFNCVYVYAIEHTISTSDYLVDFTLLRDPATRQRLLENFTHGIRARFRDIAGLLRDYAPGVTFEQFVQSAESELRAGIEAHREGFKFDIFSHYKNRIIAGTLDDKVKKTQY